METSSIVLYRGIEIPAKMITIGENKTKLIPVSTDRYVLHGVPIPRNLKITEEIRSIAKEIINNSKNTTNKNKVILVKYIRKAVNGYLSRNRHFARKGKPRGVVVAFLHNEKLKIGWSKRIEGVEPDSDTKQKEPLVFAKKDAIYVAVLRGLMDSITLSGSGAYTSNNILIPKSIVKILPPFVERVQYSFNQAVNNILMG